MNDTTTDPYLTTDVPAVAAAIKRDYADFRVDEIPAYEPSGRGDHVYFTIEKSGLGTMHAIRDLAAALGRAPRDFGVAGLKDARAVTRQWVSLEHADPERIRRLEIPRIRILNVSRHTNKLRIGHLRGNRFTLRLREINTGQIGDIRDILALLAQRGVPNYFGPQRFGSRGDTGRIGLALLNDDPQAALDLMCGRPTEADTGDVRRARRLYDAGDYAAASRAWPYLFRENARACGAMTKYAGDARRAMRAVDRNLRDFFVSAFQSWLFNRTLAARIQELDRLWPGDLAWKHANGAVFLVEDAAAEQPRAERFEISPTGPLFGRRMSRPRGAAAELETRVLMEAGVEDDLFSRPGPLTPTGSRRPLRFQPQEVSVEPGRDARGEYLELRFALPPGCYATAVLREICKDRLEEGREEE